MTIEKITEIMQEIKNGTIGVVEYKTEIPVNKDAKKAGIKIFCKTKKMVRFGADYKNLVKDCVSSDSSKPRANNYSWVIKNKVTHNSNTGKDYIRVSNINRKTLNKEYEFVTPSSVTHTSTLSGYEGFLRPSTSNSGCTRPVVQNIAVDNVISINGIA